MNSGPYNIVDIFWIAAIVTKLISVVWEINGPLLVDDAPNTF